METQTIVNLLSGTDNEKSKLATKKWYVIGSESKGNNEEKYIRELLDSSWQGVKIIKKMIIKFLLILIKNIFFQELKQKITTLKLMEEIFMIKQSMTQLNNTTKSEKY